MAARGRGRMQRGGALLSSAGRTCQKDGVQVRRQRREEDRLAGVAGDRLRFCARRGRCGSVAVVANNAKLSCEFPSSFDILCVLCEIHLKFVM